ncbi:HU family DNA-binding protein [Deinococcus sp. Leaf326]|jgi:DNA-binding protein HU-beta|uniref:HU family DNA-binding protein n=1 Tax=Deinococcus sp. Leaf326 TaxID=1736338 RepID=UPI0006FF28B0|nr:HU family DNA-binding protein [Deinococcus sp. Leaf326]KQR10917.1 DNA-binding protein [Deinococcus sp. Leaf326]
MTKPAKKAASKTKAAPESKAAPEKKAAAAPTPTPAGPAEKGKLAKAELTEQIAERANLSRKQANEAFDAMVEVLVDTLKSGKSVGLPGLGTLSVKETAARTGVRPGTSEKIQIPAGKKVAFKVAVSLKGTL